MNGSSSRRNVVITGGNRGIGFEVVRELYLRGYNVIFGSRTITRNEEAIAKITKQKQQSSLKTQQSSLNGFSSQNKEPQILKSYNLDLSSAQSIKLFTQFINKHFQHIDILINNAAIIHQKLQISQQLKVQKSLVANYFGQFQLTSLLFPLLIKSQHHNGKIINVICNQYQFFQQRTVFDDFDCQKYPFQSSKQYIIAKMMLLTMVIKLNEGLELRQLSNKVKIFAVQPGDAMTQLGDTNGAKNLYKSICCCCYQKPQQAARSIIYLATQDLAKLKSGALYGSNTDIIQIDPRVAKVQFYEKSWTLTQEILKMKFDFSN